MVFQSYTLSPWLAVEQTSCLACGSASCRGRGARLMAEIREEVRKSAIG
jgi:hypothetical protein